MASNNNNFGKFSSHTPSGSGFNGAGTPGGNGTYPTSPTSYNPTSSLLIPDPSLRGISFDQLLQNRGIRFIHRLAAPCPNINNVEDNGHDPNCQVCDGNGMFYYREKEIWGVFSSNSLQKNFEMQGIWEIGSAMVTLPTEYPDGTTAEFNTYDQLVIPDFTVRLWELKEYEPRPDGQQMRYPITSVDYMASYDNSSTLKEYKEGEDFNLVNGKISWIPGKEPEYNNVDERGDVFTINYFANPVYNVIQHLRELRVSQELVNGSKVPLKLPQQVLVKRDFLANSPETEA
jgi:hypothetical protein